MVITPTLPPKNSIVPRENDPLALFAILEASTPSVLTRDKAVGVPVLIPTLSFLGNVLTGLLINFGILASLFKYVLPIEIFGLWKYAAPVDDVKFAL